MKVVTFPLFVISVRYERIIRHASASSDAVHSFAASSSHIATAVCEYCSRPFREHTPIDLFKNVHIFDAWSSRFLFGHCMFLIIQSVQEFHYIFRLTTYILFKYLIQRNDFHFLCLKMHEMFY